MPTDRRSHGPLLILAGALCFSTTGFVQALAPEGATPYVIGALRMAVGGIALLIWCALKGLLPRRKNWPLRYLLPASLSFRSVSSAAYRKPGLPSVPWQP